MTDVPDDSDDDLLKKSDGVVLESQLDDIPDTVKIDRYL